MLLRRELHRANHQALATPTEALEGLKALKIDKGNEKDPLMQLEVLSAGDRDVGEIERYKSGLVKAFQLAPTGRIALGSFPNLELAKRAVSEAAATR